VLGSPLREGSILAGRGEGGGEGVDEKRWVVGYEAG